MKNGNKFSWGCDNEIGGSCKNYDSDNFCYECAALTMISIANSAGEHIALIVLNNEILCYWCGNYAINIVVVEIER